METSRYILVNWISFEKRLPDRGQEVQVYNPMTRAVKVLKLDDWRKVKQTYGVTHWSKMPFVVPDPGVKK